MEEKSHVGMEQKVCSVCAQIYDTGAILLDKHLRNTLKRQNLNGWGLCPEHQKLYDDEFVALVEISNDPGGQTATQENANRTGKIAHIKRKVIETLTSQKLNTPLIFVEIGLIDKLAKGSQS